MDGPRAQKSMSLLCYYKECKECIECIKNMLQVEGVLIMIQMMNRQEIIEMICSILSR